MDDLISKFETTLDLKKCSLKKQNFMETDPVNIRIQNEICKETLNELSDTNLMDDYRNCDSVKNEIKQFENILMEFVNNETKEKIVERYLLNLIPPGTKAVIRGNKFNKIIEKKINDFNMDPEKFEIHFEKKCESCMTAEIPDFYIREKETNKTIIGMNQLDLWSGGHQVNRGSKYLIDNKINTPTSKLVCVICNEKVFKTKNAKSYDFFEIGFKNDTLCYPKNLKNLIFSYFGLNLSELPGLPDLPCLPDSVPV